MSTHLRYNLFTAFDCNVTGHPQQVMNALGITYQHATPQSIADQWWFWNCEDIPEPLPKFLTVLDTTPMEQIGNGLSKEKAKELMPKP